MDFGEDNQWWYNHKTGQVEQGRKSPSIYRDGPYASREEALRAPEIWLERSAAWDADEEEKET
jgi:hypothetical protein